MDGRKLDIAVISDVHLATHASKAKILLKYLKSICPSTLVLNGDIIDSWRFTRNYFPKSHLKIIRHLLKMLENGVKIYYISGNHDEFLRRFKTIHIGSLTITDQLVLDHNGAKTWIFHGDIYDSIIHKAKWLAKLGAASYGFLTIINKFVNYFRHIFGLADIVLFKKVKKKIAKKEEGGFTKFELAVCNAAQINKCTTVICGHTHDPKDTILHINSKPIRYINCGDWVEHFSAAEFFNNDWNLNYFSNIEEELINDDSEIADTNEYYKNVFREISDSFLLFNA
jgi:UDP-2,3-diacylglucosamine pyrophosphatase LpxH